MLCYMDGLRGNQRGLAKERAEKVIVQTETDKDESKHLPIIRNLHVLLVFSISVPESKIMYKRARKVVKVLNG